MKTLAFVILIGITLLTVACAMKYVNQLQIGMTYEEVEAIMQDFKGVKVIGKATNQGTIEIYEYMFPETYYLTFKNGRLVSWAPERAYSEPDLRIDIR